MPVKTETILWLLPVVYMLHDFEEIVMMAPWMRQNAPRIRQRMPIARRFLSIVSNRSASSMAIMVGILFFIFSVITFVSVEYSLYNLWAGLFLIFFIHLIVHVAQFLLMRSYVPVIITSIAALVFCIWAAFALNARGVIDWKQAWLWALGLFALLAPVFLLIQCLGSRFETWLMEHYPQ